MYQLIDKKSLKFQVLDANFHIFSQLENYSEEVLFLHPTLSLFYDNLTIFRFVHKEILVQEDFSFNIPSTIKVNFLPKSKFNKFKAQYSHFYVELEGKFLEFQCINPELGLLWVLQDVNSQSFGLGLALLEFCNLSTLEKYKDLLLDPQVLRCIIEIGETHLNRYDLIWRIIEKFNYQEKLSDFPLYIEKFVRAERKYGKIL